MRYLVLLYGDEALDPTPGTPEFDADMEGYVAFSELAGDAIVGGEALQPSKTARTVRHGDGEVRVTDGPFAEVVEALGGFYVLDAPTLDDAAELARHIPAVASGAAEIRPMVEWTDLADERGPTPAGAARYMATIHGHEDGGETPDTMAWEEGAQAHGRFAEAAGDAIVAGAAVHPTTTATTVRVRDGELLVSDGPFSEVVEVVGGFYVLRGTPTEVDAVGSLVPVGPAGAVELRPIMELGG